MKLYNSFDEIVDKKLVSIFENKGYWGLFDMNNKLLGVNQGTRGNDKYPFHSAIRLNNLDLEIIVKDKMIRPFEGAMLFYDGKDKIVSDNRFKTDANHNDILNELILSGYKVIK